MDVIHYFSKDYAQAREKFLEACHGAAREVAVRMESYDHPLRGPNGEPLASDIAVFGDPAAEQVLLLNSATHGTEGACGSGNMVGWLRSGGYRRIPANVRVVLIHAINPHGFAHVRRVTEDNVDLNRNFVDHSAPYPVNADYARVHEHALPPQWVGPERERAEKALDAFAAEHGAFALQTAICAGQYSHPDGLFFGGNAPTWSNRTFREILHRFVAPARTVGFIDYHTGLGPYGTAELISDQPADSDIFKRAVAWYGNGVTTTVKSAAGGGDSNSPDLSGCIETAIPRELPNAVVVSVTAEYGTYPVKRVIDSLRGDHWLHNNKDRADPALAAAIKAEVRQALYPDEDDWKELVYLRSRQLIDRALSALGQGA